MLQETLKYALVAEKICDVDRSGSKYIWNPYGSKPTITVQSLAGGSQGTYTPETYTSTDDTLTVTDEFICSEQIYDFERVMQHGDIMMSRQEEIIAWLAISIDKYVNKTAYYKSTLIDLEAQKWVTRAKEIFSTLNDLMRGL